MNKLWILLLSLIFIVYLKSGEVIRAKEISVGQVYLFFQDPLRYSFDNILQASCKIQPK
jgi:hypothetical protein